MFIFYCPKKTGRLSKAVSELKEFELFVFVATILTFNVSALYSFCHFFPFEKRALREIIEAKFAKQKFVELKCHEQPKYYWTKDDLPKRVILKYPNL